MESRDSLEAEIMFMSYNEKVSAVSLIDLKIDNITNTTNTGLGYDRKKK